MKRADASHLNGENLAPRRPARSYFYFWRFS
jgi:hypothetical protein